MSRLYPKSFLRLILIGSGLILLPLVVALIHAAVNVQSLSEKSELAVREATIATRTSREMLETLTSMERALKQYLILHDESLLTDYRGLHREFVKATQEYSRLPLDETGRARLIAMLDREQKLMDALDSGASIPAEEFSAIADQAHGVLTASNRLVDAEIERLRSTAAEARRMMIWQLLAALPVTLGIALWFRSIISSQLRQVDRAVRAIGRAEYADGVTVAGPQDLAYLGRRLDWLRRRLSELEEQKTRFLRHVSHDLKTPLTSIREGAQLLAEEIPGPLNEPQKTIITILDQNSRRLQQLIEELINYQQAGFAANTIDPQPVALDVVCTQVLRAHRLVAAARAIRFERNLAPILVEGDAEQLRAIVDNLITNAIKFSPRDGAIRVALVKTEDCAVLDVEDDGPGVARDERDHIFEPFFRGTRSRRGTVKGSGLGLAIVKEYVHAHRGKIQVVETAQGGHFRVTLPLKWQETA